MSRTSFRHVALALAAALSLPPAAAAPAAAQGGRPDTRPEFVIVTIGDSYAAGEGNPQVPGVHEAPFYKPSPAEVWGPANDGDHPLDARRCHRSPFAASAVAAESLQARHPEVKITFVSFACSGSMITAGALNSYAGIELELQHLAPLAPQIAQINQFFSGRPGTRIDALVMNIGGNDAQFGSVVFWCMLVPDTLTIPDTVLGPNGLPRRRTIPGCHDNPVMPSVLANMRRLSGLYARLDSAIVGTGRSFTLNPVLRPGRVYLTEVPDPTHGGPPGSGPAGNPAHYCSRASSPDQYYGSTSPNEGRFISDSVVTPLNAAMRAAATAHDWEYVGGIVSDFYAHGMCAPDSWYRKNSEGLRDQGADVIKLLALDGQVVLWQYPLSAAVAHPNRAGHRAIAKRLVDEISPQIRERFLGGAPTLSVEGVAAAPQLVARTPNVGALKGDAGATITAVGVGPMGGSITVRWNDPIPDGARRFVLSADGRETELPAGTTRHVYQQSGRFAFRVKACGVLGCGPFSNTLIVSNVRPGVPAALRTSSAPSAARFGGTVALSWTPADEFAERFEVQYRRLAAGAAPPAETLTTTGTTATLGSPTRPLATGDRYEVRVRACSQAGCSELGPALSLTVGAAAPGPEVPARPDEQRPRTPQPPEGPSRRP